MLLIGVASSLHGLIFLPGILLDVQCRLEANYAHQQELDMIPLKMQENYNPQGWRKLQRLHALSCVCTLASSCC